MNGSFVLVLLATAALAEEAFSFGGLDYDVLQTSIMVQHSQLSSSTAPSNKSTKTLLPEFVTVLFKCWGKREDNTRYRECLESMGEGERAAQIMAANSVTAFIGVFDSSDQKSIGPKHSNIAFNISSISPSKDDVKFGEIRIFRKAMTMESIHLHSNPICDLTNGVNVTLLEETADGQQQVIDVQFIDRRKLRRDQWMVFSNVDNLLTDGKGGNSSNRTVRIELQGGCASVAPETVGIREIPFKLPLFAAFMKTSSNEIKATHKIITSNTVRSKRQQLQPENSNTDNTPCKLLPMKVEFKDLGWDKFIIGPSSYTANVCSGTCHYPLSSSQKATLHSQIQAFYHHQQPVQVPSPCCTPTKLVSLPVIMAPDKSTIQIKVLQNMTATECGCR